MDSRNKPQSTLNGEKINITSPTRENNQTPTYGKIKNKFKAIVRTAIIMIIISFVFFASFALQTVFDMPYEFNKNLPVKIVATNINPFSITIENDDRYENTLDKVTTIFIESASDNFIKKVSRENKTVLGIETSLFEFECNSINGKGEIKFKNDSNNKMFTAIGIKIGKGNTLTAICDAVCSEMIFKLNKVEIKELQNTTSTEDGNVYITMNRFNGIIKNKSKEILFHIQIEPNEEKCDLNIEKINEDKYVITSTHPIKTLSVTFDENNTNEKNKEINNYTCTVNVTGEDTIVIE